METSNSLLYQKSTFVLQTHVKMEDHAKIVSLNTAVPANNDSLGTIVNQVGTWKLYTFIFLFLPPETSNSLLYQKSTFVLQTHVKMEDHAKMVSLDTAVPANKDLLGTIVKQVCINTLCIYLIGSFHF